MASTDDSVDLVEASDNEETNAFNHFMNKYDSFEVMIL